jgi:hypothetical protein
LHWCDSITGIGCEGGATAGLLRAAIFAGSKWMGANGESKEFAGAGEFVPPE